MRGDGRAHASVSTGVVAAAGAAIRISREGPIRTIAVNVPSASVRTPVTGRHGAPGEDAFREIERCARDEPIGAGDVRAAPTPALVTRPRMRTRSP